MIDYDFITRLEGNSLVGYVPEPDGGEIESGVTIGSGFDVGQRTQKDLQGLPTDIRWKLAPYCNLTGQDAIDFLQEYPLILSERQCRELNKFSHYASERSLIHRWNYYSKIPWVKLTDRQQTVVASVAYQYGDLPSRTPNFWWQVTTGDWDAAIDNLRNFGDNFNTRRNKEADYLIGEI